MLESKIIWGLKEKTGTYIWRQLDFLGKLNGKSVTGMHTAAWPHPAEPEVRTTYRQLTSADKQAQVRFSKKWYKNREAAFISVGNHMQVLA